MSDALAIAVAVAGALSLTWAGFEIAGYRSRRKREGPGATGRDRLRVALLLGLATVGGMLGLVVGAALRS